MNAVERFRNAIRFKPFDCLPAVEWAPYWGQTLDRWHTEGLPKTCTHYIDVQTFFELDNFYCIRSLPFNTDCPKPAFHGAPLIKSADDYYALKKYLYPRPPGFSTSDIKKYAAQQRVGNTIIWLVISGFFWHPRTLFGIEPHFYAFYDNPELMHMMNKDILEYHLYVLDELCSICIPDIMTFAEDMSFNHGPMLSKKLFDEFISPYYRRIISHLKKRGIPVFADSDGDVTELLPWIMEVGIEGILPLERMAGVDVTSIRKRHPRFLMLGAFDKTVMSKGESAMRAEFERLLPVMRQGGFICGVDHQTPPDVSLDMYKCYISLLKEYCKKAAL